MNEPAVIFEDNHIIVVIKPQNVPCCPDESGDENLLDEIKEYLCRATGKAEKHVSLVHRLDRVTGGVMVYAKTSKAAARLCEQIKDGRFEKIYLAAVNGMPKEREGKIVNYLIKNEAKNVVEIVPPATVGAKSAELSYTVLNKSPFEDDKALFSSAGLSLVEVKLETGRSHQIRVQMAGIGCPIFGDAKYGKGTFRIKKSSDILAAEIKRPNLALWAHKLSFVHPTTEDVMRFVVNPPEEIPWTFFDFDRRAHKTEGRA